MNLLDLSETAMNLECEINKFLHVTVLVNTGGRDGRIAEKDWKKERKRCY